MNYTRTLAAVACLAALGGCEAGDSGGASTAAAKQSAAAPEVDKAAQWAVEVRESVFKLLRQNFGPLAGMARGKRPFDADVVQTNAVRMMQLGAMVEDSFATDTRGSGVETEALDKIWADPAAFAAKIDALMTATTNLVELADSGDEATIVPAIGEVGRACGSCHDDFREDDD